MGLISHQPDACATEGDTETETPSLINVDCYFQQYSQINVAIW